MGKTPRWASIAALCVLLAVYVAGLLAFRSAAGRMREALTETNASVPFGALAACFVLDISEYALAVGGLVLVAGGAAVELLVKKRWIAVVVYLGSSALYVGALYLGYRARARAAGA